MACRQSGLRRHGPGRGRLTVVRVSFSLSVAGSQHKEAAALVSHPWTQPVRLWNEPHATERLPKIRPAQQCICPGFCGGRHSADWLSCSIDCGACNPPKRRRRGALDPDDPGLTASNQGTISPGSPVVGDDPSSADG